MRDFKNKAQVLHSWYDWLRCSRNFFNFNNPTDSIILNRIGFDDRYNDFRFHTITIKNLQTAHTHAYIWLYFCTEIIVLFMKMFFFFQKETKETVPNNSCNWNQTKPNEAEKLCKNFMKNGKSIAEEIWFEKDDSERRNVMLGCLNLTEKSGVKSFCVR